MRPRLRGVPLVLFVMSLLVVPATPAMAVGVSPTLEVTPATCDLHGATDVLVRAGGLENGESYVVGIAVASDRTPIDSQKVSGDARTASLVFEDVPNGDSYVVSIANAENTVGASATVTLPVCDLPTLPGELPSATPPVIDDLAFTGSTPLVPALGGVALIQLGVVLLGIALALARGPKAQRPTSR